MIAKTYYLTDPLALDRLVDMTDLEIDDIETIVGRFRSNHWRFAGLLKGEVYEYFGGRVDIKHHFTKKVLWTNRDDI